MRAPNLKRLPTGRLRNIIKNVAAAQLAQPVKPDVAAVRTKIVTDARAELARRGLQ